MLGKHGCPALRRRSSGSRQRGILNHRSMSTTPLQSQVPIAGGGQFQCIRGWQKPSFVKTSLELEKTREQREHCKCLGPLPNSNLKWACTVGPLLRAHLDLVIVIRLCLPAPVPRLALLIDPSHRKRQQRLGPPNHTSGADAVVRNFSLILPSLSTRTISWTSGTHRSKGVPHNPRRS